MTTTILIGAIIGLIILTSHLALLILYLRLLGYIRAVDSKSADTFARIGDVVTVLIARVAALEGRARDEDAGMGETERGI